MSFQGVRSYENGDVVDVYLWQLYSLKMRMEALKLLWIIVKVKYLKIRYGVCYLDGQTGLSISRAYLKSNYFALNLATTNSSLEACGEFRSG